MMIASSTFLRRVLAADAVASAGAGLLFALGGAQLQALTGLPAEISQPMGAFLVGYAAVVGCIASRSVVRAALVWAVVLVNLLWAVESIVLLSGEFLRPTLLGQGLVFGQAAAVAAFAILEMLGLRRSPRLADRPA